MSVKSVCVYCGSSNTVADTYKNTARDIGITLAKQGLDIVYGGGHVGLMGIVADSALKAGAKVFGIIPEHIRAQEVQHTGLTELHVVPDMHTRKRMMVDRSDAFIILPGGLGTMDEAFEVMTWKKLKLHDKPIVVFNQNGYWNPFLAVIERCIAENFAAPSDRKLLTVVDTIPAMMDSLLIAPPSKEALVGRM